MMRQVRVNPHISRLLMPCSCLAHAFSRLLTPCSRLLTPCSRLAHAFSRLLTPFSRLSHALSRILTHSHAFFPSILTPSLSLSRPADLPPQPEQHATAMATPRAPPTAAHTRPATDGRSKLLPPGSPAIKKVCPDALPSISPLVSPHLASLSLLLFILTPSSRLFTPSHAFPRLPTPSHAFSPLPPYLAAPPPQARGRLRALHHAKRPRRLFRAEHFATQRPLRKCDRRLWGGRSHGCKGLAAVCSLRYGHAARKARLRCLGCPGCLGCLGP